MSMDVAMVAIAHAFGWMVLVLAVLLAVGLVTVGAVNLVKTTRHA